MSLEQKQPSDELQDKVHFLFNNISSKNLQEKVINICIYLVVAS